MFRKKLESEIEINASTTEIWKTLIEFEKYEQWNNSLICIAENNALKEKDDISNLIFDVIICPRLKSKTKAKVEIIYSEKGKKLLWRGRFLGLGFLLTGDHIFELLSLEPNKTKLLHYEYFNGILVPIVWPIYLNTVLREVFSDFNQALKFKFQK